VKTRPYNCFVDSKGEGHINLRKLEKRKARCAQCDFRERSLIIGGRGLVKYLKRKPKNVGPLSN
jgi:hypothetical protein